MTPQDARGDILALLNSNATGVHVVATYAVASLDSLSAEPGAANAAVRPAQLHDVVTSRSGTTGHLSMQFDEAWFQRLYALPPLLCLPRVAFTSTLEQHATQVR